MNAKGAIDISRPSVTITNPGAGGGASPDYHESTNASGTTTITVGADTSVHTELTAVTGVASTRVFALVVSSPPLAGAIIRHRLTLPLGEDIRLEWRNASAGGTLEASYQSGGSDDSVVIDLVFNGSAWKFDRFHAPQNA